jgi:hypothetical protein
LSLSDPAAAREMKLCAGVGLCAVGAWFRWTL